MTRDEQLAEVPTSPMHDHWTSRSAEIAVPRGRTDLEVQELEDEAIVFDPVRGDTHKLNPTALWIWHQCDGRATTRQIAARLATDFDINPDVAQDDVEQSLLAFAERYLLDGTVMPADRAFGPEAGTV